MNAMSQEMDPARVIAYATELDGVEVHRAWGETSCFYNPGGVLPRGTYFLTIKVKDGANDCASRLNRDGAWRLNIGLPRPSFEAMFGPPPKRPAKGGVVEGPWDFAVADRIMPHPVYGWMSWVAVVSPRLDTWQYCLPLVAAARLKAKSTFEKRLAAAKTASARTA
jgi:hypothetical protein